MKYDQLLEDVRRIAQPVLDSQGLELVDLEYQRDAQGWVLRVYIDRPGGITVEECAEVNRELGMLLEIQDLIPNPYVLEVSSPGLTRPLKKPEDYHKYSNRLIKVKTFAALEGRKNFKGTLLSLEGETVRLEVEGKVYEIPLSGIAKANLEIEF